MNRFLDLKLETGTLGSQKTFMGRVIFVFFLPNGHFREKHFDCCAEARCKGSKTRDREIRYESVVLV